MNKYSTTNWRRYKYKPNPHSYGEVHRRRQSYADQRSNYHGTKRNWIQRLKKLVFSWC